MSFLTGIGGFFAKEAVMKIAAIVAVAAIGGVVTYCSLQEENEVRRAEGTGIVKQKAAQQEEVLKDVQKAQDAVNDSTPGDRERMRCKYDRSASCK